MQKETIELRAKLKELEKKPDARKNADGASTIALYHEQIYYNENSKSDLLTAIMWWNIANDLGAPDATLGLGQCYLALSNVEKNLDYLQTAINYLNDAGRKGYSQADEILLDLEAELTADGNKSVTPPTKSDKPQRKRHVGWFLMGALLLYSGYVSSYAGCYVFGAICLFVYFKL